MGRLFGTDGVRGVVGVQLTPELALRLGRAIGAFFGKGSRILVGRDVRAGGSMIKSAVVAGLLSEGVKVYDANYIPTPGLQYNVKEGPYDGGVMITASHNPPEYNGIKVIAGDGIEVSREDEEVIEEYYFKGTGSVLEWRSYVHDPIVLHDAIDLYIDGILGNLERLPSLESKHKVLVDCANSVGSLVTPRVLREMGVQVRTINCNLDPLFPGREPEPTPETLKEAAEMVVRTGASLGVGHDGDADRAIIIDDTGNVVWGDRTGALLSGYVSGRWKGLPRRVYTGVSSSTAVEDYLKPLGIEVVWTPVGSVVISRMIQRDGGAISGFEENGGYMHVPHQTVRDGAMKAALLVHMVDEEGSLSSLLKALPQYYPVKTKLPATREQAACAVEAVKEHYSNLRQVTIDGVKVFGDGYWVLVRPSGTEPVVRIMLEARDPSKADELLREVKSLLKNKCGIG
ncbi:MAG: phosphoglucosamine mutase [Desulfurococcales archaeon]|nr:phosphoglucosamine mutase [Desulfurococcales archaeon]